MTVDFSRHRVDAAIVGQLARLAEACGLAERRSAMFSGMHINATEDRPVLHAATRSPLAPWGDAIRRTFADDRAAMDRFVRAVLDGSIRSSSGHRFRHVVHVGIGGSVLGPALLVDALRSEADRVDVRFVANVDGEVLRRTLAGLDGERTLFVIASKSFSTQETLHNAATIRCWLAGRGLDPAGHFVAIAANRDAAIRAGVAPDRILPMADGIGGRFSLWSAIGLPFALAHGTGAIDELHRGAAMMDEHFCSAPTTGNIPVLAALLEIWNLDFLGMTSRAVLAYDHRLRLLPEYLQQLEMESNGKQVLADGSPATAGTAGVIWGGEGTNGQHAYHQFLHQGTRPTPCDFIVSRTPAHAFAEHHPWLVANCLAQAELLANGRRADPDDPLGAHRAHAGDRPSTMIVLDDVSPFSLGALLAMYEHKVFVQGVVWGINSFDQWGVERGKEIGRHIHEALVAGDARPALDPVTGALLPLFATTAGSRHGSGHAIPS